MFLPPDQRPTPPRWEPPRRSRRAEDTEEAARALVLMVRALYVVAPASAVAVLAVRALRGPW